MNTHELLFTPSVTAVACQTIHLYSYLIQHRRAKSVRIYALSALVGFIHLTNPVRGELPIPTSFQRKGRIAPPSLSQVSQVPQRKSPAGKKLSAVSVGHWAFAPKDSQPIRAVAVCRVQDLTNHYP